MKLKGGEMNETPHADVTAADWVVNVQAQFNGDQYAAIHHLALLLVNEQHRVEALRAQLAAAEKKLHEYDDIDVALNEIGHQVGARDGEHILDAVISFVAAATRPVLDEELVKLRDWLKQPGTKAEAVRTLEIALEVLERLAGERDEAVKMMEAGWLSVVESGINHFRDRAEAAEKALIGEKQSGDAWMADCKAAERALKERDRELDWLRRKFDQLLPGEHVWSAANEVIKWPHCSVCGIILRTDYKNSPCKGAAKIGLRDDSARKAGT